MIGKSTALSFGGMAVAALLMGSAFSAFMPNDSARLPHVAVVTGAHAQPVGEEEEDTGARVGKGRGALSGKRVVSEPGAGRRVIKRMTAPKSRVRTRDHRSNRATRSGGDSGVVYATSSLKCDDGTVYEVSTGNDKGECSPTMSGNENVMVCDDGKGNTASAGCYNGCGGATGSGSCKVKQ